MIVAFTGHRPDKLDGYDRMYRGPVSRELKVKVRAWLQAARPEYAYIGMARGFDTIAALACVECDVPYIACVPFPAQASRWPEADRDMYQTLLDGAYQVRVTGDNPRTQADAAAEMRRRNRFMVVAADELVAAWDGSDGGTANTVRAALARGLPIHHLLAFKSTNVLR